MEWKQFATHRLNNGNYRIVLMPQIADDRPVEIEMTKDDLLGFANSLIKTVEGFEQKHNQ